MHGKPRSCGSLDSCHRPPHDLPTHCQTASHHHLQIRWLNLRDISQKVDYVPKSNIAIIWTPIFERYVIRCESKDEHQTKMCCIWKRSIGPCAQNRLIILGSTINIDDWNRRMHVIAEEWPTKHKTISSTHCYKYCPVACHHLQKWLNLIAISLNFVI
jgi:hypothetical protein